MVTKHIEARVGGIGKKAESLKLHIKFLVPSVGRLTKTVDSTMKVVN